MDKTILIVIDVQPAFKDAISPILIKNCQRLIDKALKEINPIYFVEYRGSGKTVKELTSLTKNYPYKDTVFKNEMSGARAIHNRFQRCRIKPKNLIVCGVYTDQCVYGTAMGLRDLGYNVSLKLDACGTTEEFVGDAKRNINKLIGKGVEVM